jgi:hypothetical protein
MPFSPLALVTSAVSALYFVVAALCVRWLSRGRFGFRALHVAVGSRVLGGVSFVGCVACASFWPRCLTHHSNGLPTAAAEFRR